MTVWAGRVARARRGAALAVPMPRARVEQVTEAVRRTYRTPAGAVPNILIEAPGRGASVVME